MNQNFNRWGRWSALTAACVASVALTGCVVAPVDTPYYDSGYGGYSHGSSTYTNGYYNGTYYPAMPHEVIPVRPYAGAIWISGYWGGDHNHRRWVPGRYAHHDERHNLGRPHHNNHQPNHNYQPNWNRPGHRPNERPDLHQPHRPSQPNWPNRPSQPGQHMQPNGNRPHTNHPIVTRPPQQTIRPPARPSGHMPMTRPNPNWNPVNRMINTP